MNSRSIKLVRIKNKFHGLFVVILVTYSLFVVPIQGWSLQEKDQAMLLQIQRDSFQYFVRMSDKKSGLTHDSSREGSPASISATGFALAAIAIGGTRGWIPEDYAKGQINKTLETLLHKAEHEKGFFYHFLDPQTGKRIWSSEASSIDTALLIAGALVAALYYSDAEITKKVYEIYNRVDWKWMMNNSDLICMGWKPESGFLPYYWDSYNELIILQALAIGATNHAIPAAAWQSWLRNVDQYKEHEIIYSHSGSLFTYQFSHAFIDFRKLDDRGINYFENSRLATLANRDYSLSFRNQYKGYNLNAWGLSASLGPGGYKAYGAKPGDALHDGTLAPYAAISSIVFTSEISIPTIRHFYEKYSEKLYGQFGFKDAFNLDKNWWADEYIGIDQGITVLMLENFLKDGLIWKKFMSLDSIQRWVDLAELKKIRTGLK